MNRVGVRAKWFQIETEAPENIEFLLQQHHFAGTEPNRLRDQEVLHGNFSSIHLPAQLLEGDSFVRGMLIDQR